MQRWTAHVEYFVDFKIDHCRSLFRKQFDNFMSLIIQHPLKIQSPSLSPSLSLSTTHASNTKTHLLVFYSKNHTSNIAHVFINSIFNIRVTVTVCLCVYAFNCNCSFGVMNFRQHIYSITSMRHTIIFFLCKSWNCFVFM